MVKKIILEIAESKDQAYISKVYFSTRKEEFAMLGWSDAQLAVFLEMQFEAQQQSYAMQFPEAENSVIKIEENGQATAVGRLIVERLESEMRLVDIAFLPEFRGRGIGGKIIKNLIAEAENKGLPLNLTVMKNNSGAFRLYQRLGFEISGEDELYISMKK